MGTSVENQDTVWRIKELKCHTRFVSFEPLENVGKINLSKIDWVIIGGESRAGYREDTRYYTSMQNTPVFFKQWGGPRPQIRWTTPRRQIIRQVS